MWNVRHATCRIAFLVCAQALLVATCCHLSAEEDVDLDHPWTDGLYSTITAISCADDIKPVAAKSIALNVDGMKKPLQVQVSLQKAAAPLVVLLGGVFSRAAAAPSVLWSNWLHEQGFHVVRVDSPFSPAFQRSSQHGVAGNLSFEASLVARIVEALLKHPSVKGKVTKIGLVGMSYGGILALHLSRMQKEGKLSFRLAAIRAYSPPVSFAWTMGYLDRNFGYKWLATEMHWKFAGLKRSYPLKETYEPDMMRNAVARVFREGLAKTVQATYSLYGPQLAAAGAPALSPKDTEPADVGGELDYARLVSFETFTSRISAPYWVARKVLVDKNELLSAGELTMLLGNSSPESSVVIAGNDPLNETGAAETLKGKFPSSVLLLPRGGHLGYVDAKWVRRDLAGLFERGVAAREASKPNVGYTPREAPEGAER